MQRMHFGSLNVATELLKAVNTLSGFVLAVLSLILVRKNSSLRYDVPLVVLAISSLAIVSINVIEYFFLLHPLKDAGLRVRHQSRIKLVLLVCFNFMIFGTGICFINNIVVNNSFDDYDRKFVVAQIAFLLLQQLTFFSMLLNYRSETDISYYTDPESLVMKPMRIPTKNIQNKASEQTLTSDMDWLQQHELKNNFYGAPSVNKYDLQSFESSEKKHEKIGPKRWRRAFSNLIKVKEQKNDKQNPPKPVFRETNLGFNSSSVLNLKPVMNQYSNDTKSLSSQPDLSYDATVMLEINTRHESEISNKVSRMEKMFSESFEKEINAEQLALSKINSRLLPPRLTTKQSYPTLQHKSGGTSRSGSIRIPSEELESPAHTLSRIPDRYHNELQLSTKHQNVTTKMDLGGEVDAIDFLDNVFTLRKKANHNTNPSLDFSNSYEFDEEMINSALSDSLSKRSIKKTTTNENNYMNTRHSPTKSISSLMMLKHKRTHSHVSTQGLNTSPKKANYPSHSKHAHSKTLSTKLSLSNISFNINEDGKIDFSSQKLTDFEPQGLKEQDSKKELLWEESLRLGDIAETRKISEKSFDYPQVLVSEYDKEKWKIISDYSLQL